ncbi:putative lipid II flippase FtsW [Thermoproteota archaeon]
MLTNIQQKAPFVLFFSMLALVVIGLIMMFSTSFIVGFANYNDSYFFIKRHIVFLAIGAIGFLSALKIPLRVYKRMIIPGLIFSLLLLGSTFIPGIGVMVGGAHRWVNAGLFNLQPVEIVKFFIIVFIALVLENKRESITSFKQGILPILFVLGIPLLILAKQPDLGNIVLISSVTMALFWISRIRLVHIASLIMMGFAGIGITILTHAYQLERIKTFLSPWQDPTGKSYHIIQSFIAIGSGGLYGLGLGQGKLKYFYLPLHYSDFIFSILCEEGGFILGSLVIVLFTMLLFSGIRIAKNAKTEFGYYLGMGLILLLVVQAFINMGVVIGVFPVTGIPLTFISFGGTSLITSMVYVGILLRIANESAAVKETSIKLEKSENYNDLGRKGYFYGL